MCQKWNWTKIISSKPHRSQTNAWNLPMFPSQCRDILYLLLEKFPAVERNGFSYLEVLLNNPHSQPIFWEFLTIPFPHHIATSSWSLFGWCFRMTNSFSCCWENLPHTHNSKNWQRGLPSFHVGVIFFSGNISSNGWMSSGTPSNPHKSHFRLCDGFRPGTSWQCCHFVPQTLIDCWSLTVSC